MIRRAKESDFDEIVILLKEFSTFQGNSPEKVCITAQQMREDKHLFGCFVAVAENNDIVGFATHFFAYYSWTGKVLYLDDLYVKEAFRQQGVGKCLLTAVIELAKEQSCKKVRWQVSRWNTHAIAFYKSLGTTIDEVEINCEYIIEC